MAKSKLKAALENFKGVDHKLERQRKLQKQAEKKKRAKTKAQVDNSEEEAEAQTNGKHVSEEQDSAAEGDWESDEEKGGAVLDISRIDDSDSSSDEDEPTNGAEEEDEDEDEEDIPLSDIASVASEEKGDIVPYQRLTINNTTALLAAHKRIALPLANLPFSAHQSITTTEPVAIVDVDDDLNRELAFYAQSLSSVRAARAQFKSEGVSFSRPADYFAEMVKSDEHMGRVKAKLVDAAAGKKAASDARRQRDLKKFGKQVQVAKLQERDKSKRETLDKINLLKRKRGSAPIAAETEPDLFDVELEDTAESAKNDREARKSQRGGSRGGDGNTKRRKKDEKFGFGGKKRFGKSGDAKSSADMRDYSVSKMKGKTGGRGGAASRPGKARRAAGRP